MVLPHHRLSVAKYAQRYFSNFLQLSFTKTAPNMARIWDMVVLTAGDTQQKKAFELQLADICKSETDLPFKESRVYTDWPEGVKIGSGGATCVSLDHLFTEFGRDALSQMRILLLNAGGYSQRQPSASVLGKIFTSLPRRTKTGGLYTVLHLKLDSYLPLLERMPPGVFIAASDALEHFTLQSDQRWTLEDSDFTVFAHPNEPKIGVNHGVFVLDREQLQSKIMGPIDSGKRPTNICVEVTRVMQKPTLAQMEMAGAIWESGSGCGNPQESVLSHHCEKNGTVPDVPVIALDGKGEKTSEMSEYTNKEVPLHATSATSTTSKVFTDSAYFMSFAVCEALHAFYISNKPLACELDCYGDFLQPLGVNASNDYFTDTARVVSSHPDLPKLRRELFDRLHTFSIQALVLMQSTFYHIGTLPELLDHVCGRESLFQKHFGLLESSPSSECGSIICGEDLPSSVKIIACAASKDFSLNIPNTDSKVLLEFCHFENGSMTIANDCLVSGCHVTGDYHIDCIPLFLTTIPVLAQGSVVGSNIFSVSSDGGGDSSLLPPSNLRYVTIAFGILDDTKRKSRLTTDLVWLGRKLSSSPVFVDRVLSPNVSVHNSIASLWTLPLFPVADSMSSSFELTMEMVDTFCSCGSLDNLTDCDRISMTDALNRKSVGAILKYRSGLK